MCPEPAATLLCENPNRVLTQELLENILIAFIGEMKKNCLSIHLILD